MALTDIMIRNAKSRDKQYKLSDSGGLYVLMHPNGAKYWRLKYRVAAKEKVLSLGTYPIVTLGMAREKALKAKEMLVNKIDPSQAKKEEKLKNLVDADNTFEAVARCWHDTKKAKWTTKYAFRLFKRLEDDVFPSLGFKAINEIKPQELLATIRAIEARDAVDLAHRILQICGQVFRYAVATGRTERDISTDLSGALKTRMKEHY